MAQRFRDLAEQYREDIVRTAAEMIRINSQSTQEKEFADYTAQKMRELGYDEVIVDTYGSVFGTVNGTGGGSSVTLNCHMDVVDAGDPANWSYPPYGGVIAEGKIWGRGASDTKGTFAIQLYVPAILKKHGLMPKGDIVVAGVVSEEIAGFGSMMQTRDNFKLTDYCIVGEATENDIAIGSRGRCCIVVTIRGRSCHASMPAEGKNPFDFLTRFLPELPAVEMARDNLFGSSCLSPTSIMSSEKGTNIIPNEVVLYLDYRQVGGDTEEAAVAKIRQVAERCAVEGISADVRALYFPLTTYTGFQGMGYQGEPPFVADPDADYIRLCKSVLEEVSGRPIQTKPWAFATDTGHFAQKGVKCLGYSPAEIRLCHTTQDHIDIAMMQEGIAGYLALITALANRER